MTRHDPRAAQLRTIRFAEQARLKALTDRLIEIDGPRHPHALDAMRQALQATKDRLAEIEAELAGADVVVIERPEDDQERARVVLRGRLQHLLLALDRHAPPSCEDTVRQLRRKITEELRQLGRRP